jgi:hypothetical protein
MPPFNWWIGFIVTLALAYLLYRLMERFMFIQQRTFLPFFFFILFTGAYPQFHQLTNGLIGFAFLLFSIWQILSTFHKNQSTEAAFNAGMALSIGYFFVFDFLFLIPLVFICLYIVNNLTIKVMIAVLLGLLTPAALVFGGSFWFDQMDIPVNYFLNGFQFDFSHFSANHGIILLHVIFTVIALIAVGGCFQNRFSSTIVERKNLQVFVWFFFSLLILTTIRLPRQNDILISYLGICSVIFAINFSSRFSKKNTIVFFILLLSLLINLIVAYNGLLA